MAELWHKELEFVGDDDGDDDDLLYEPFDFFLRLSQR
jgi:hypothetical protein